MHRLQVGCNSPQGGCGARDAPRQLSQQLLDFIAAAPASEVLSPGGSVNGPGGLDLQVR